MEGLTSAQVAELQKRYGKNTITGVKHESLLLRIIHTITEPTILLLIVTTILYLILGELSDGLIMIFSVAAIIIIDIIQGWKTDKALRALKDLSEPKITALRDGKKVQIQSAELVPGDIIFIEEGVKIPADGVVIKNTNLAVDESSLTGESIPVWKTTSPAPSTDYWRQDYCYQGTFVTQGTGALRVDKIGNQTEYGKIGTNLNNVTESKTLLQKQTSKIIKIATIVAFCLFLLITIITFINSSHLELSARFIESLLSGLAIAIAMIPEEFPVILTVFLSMGAWRLTKKHSVIRRLPKVEVLGAITTLCVDKTGTITKNNMKVTDVFTNLPTTKFAEYLALCSEKYTYDPMEKAIFNYANDFGINKKELFKNQKLKDFPFNDTIKIVGAAWHIDNKNLIVIKGSPENVLSLCRLTSQKRKEIESIIQQMQKRGLRVIAGAQTFCYKTDLKSNELTDFDFNFTGIIGLSDPPRKGIKNYINKCYAAGIRTVMITGDNGTTAAAIASAVGIKNPENILTGKEIDQMTDQKLSRIASDITIFSRVTPEHKMRIIKALQKSGEIVAMTGDGVNDAPALKQADIGIAMGKRGSEVSREAADLVLLDDNFKTIVDTIEDGRRIYENIKKAIEYIIIIHIPIALSALIAPLLGIDSASLFLLPPQIVLFELVIDPTCSIVLERRPADSDTMNKPPRRLNENILDRKHLLLSLLQGLIIFIASFGSYLLFLPFGAVLARTVGLTVILASSLFLVFVYSSEQDFAYKSFLTLIRDKVVLGINLTLIAIYLVIIYSPLNQVFRLAPCGFFELIYSLLIAAIAVFWFEIVKLARRHKHQSPSS